MSLRDEKSAVLAEALQTAERIAKKEIPLPQSDNLMSLLLTLQQGRMFAAACSVLQRTRSETPAPWIADQLAKCIADYARQIERADCDPPTFKTVKNLLVKELKRDWAFRLAWKALKVLAKSPLWQPEEKVWIVQQLALCTYKDEELQPASRFDKALTLLSSIGLCNPDTVDPTKIPPSTLPETLALGGAVLQAEVGKRRPSGKSLPGADFLSRRMAVPTKRQRFGQGGWLWRHGLRGSKRCLHSRCVGRTSKNHRAYAVDSRLPNSVPGRRCREAAS